MGNGLGKCGSEASFYDSEMIVDPLLRATAERAEKRLGEIAHDLYGISRDVDDVAGEHSELSRLSDGLARIASQLDVGAETLRPQSTPTSAPESSVAPAGGRSPERLRHKRPGGVGPWPQGCKPAWGVGYAGSERRLGPVCAHRQRAESG